MPLRTVGWGLLLVLLDLRLNGFDVLLDPLGWILVGVAVARLAAGDPRARNLRLLVPVALVLSVTDLLKPGDSPDWFAWLESVSAVVEAVVMVLLAGYLAERASDAGARQDARSWALLRRWLVVVLVGTVIFLGLFLTAGLPVALVVLGLAISLVTAVVLVVLCFRHASRPWALAHPLNSPAPQNRA